MENGKLPAFASVAIAENNSYNQEGLSKREYFAGKALQGLLSLYDSDGGNILPNNENVVYMAKLAVTAADALLSEL